MIALITSTVHASVSPDKIAAAFGKAFRKLEQGIIDYGYETDQLFQENSNLQDSKTKNDVIIRKHKNHAAPSKNEKAYKVLVQ